VNRSEEAAVKAVMAIVAHYEDGPSGQCNLVEYPYYIGPLKHDVWFRNRLPVDEDIITSDFDCLTAQSDHSLDDEYAVRKQDNQIASLRSRVKVVPPVYHQPAVKRQRRCHRLRSE